MATIRTHREAAGRLDTPFEVTVGGECSTPEDVAAWEDAGVDRLIVTPWTRSAQVLDAMDAFASGLHRLRLIYELQMIACGSV